MGIFESNSDYNKYKVFYVVAENNSFSKAAEILHISQPAISYAIKELEYQLDTKLFIRENRKIILTEDGNKLMYHLNRAFTDINIAERIIREKKNDYTGIIRIGIYNHISLIILPNLFKKFTKKHPNVKLEVFTSTSSDLKEKLKNRELDFIITQYPVITEENSIITEEKIFELENCFFSTKEVYRSYINNELSEYSLILPYRGYVDIDTLEVWLTNTNLKFKNNFRIYAFDLTKELVKQNLGIGWGPKKCIERELNNKELFELSLNVQTPNTKFSISYNKKALNETNLEFIKELKEEIKNY